LAIANIFDQLHRDEGLRLKPYRDTAGKLTIGYGRNLDDKGIAEVEANYLLSRDVYEVNHALASALPWFATVDGARQGVLQNMGFNLGIAGLLGFRNMLSYMQAGDWANAAKEGRNSEWYTQVGARAERLMVQLETGVWQ
jgi:lysozyme